MSLFTLVIAREQDEKGEIGGGGKKPQKFKYNKLLKYFQNYIKIILSNFNENGSKRLTSNSGQVN